ncbi:MAG: ABC transporter ATP-binding protein/permease [Clostridia bacterium]|nr:ABC transporter ATP-binding protein/permease [Clostridia bacterium]
MLQIKNLTKIYRPKKGQPVTALDGVSLRFPQKGMVFLLGKSGSGKSTLLNLLGGLDSFDEGEILISGQKTDRFRGKDFDSYRNTLVGFIFQEYNVLEEFTVGANIALALELQGKRATDEEINEILQEVDLEGYGGRRPNELSGGQKQRVAIARALVKKPKIIMADEPTGALDSATGRQILDTLKKLSAQKLVIVVSHDREFAEQYADRIIELADGKVIDDVEFEADVRAFSEQGITYGDGEILVSPSYRLTEEDREQINAYLAAMEEGKSLSLRFRAWSRRRKKTEEKESSSFSEPLSLIRSRLPLKAAFRIGAGALKHKKFRLVFTILLSCVAFGLFGLSDTFGAYDHITACVESIEDSHISYASVQRREKVWQTFGDKKEYYMSDGGRLRERELDEIKQKTGLETEGVFIPYAADLNFSHLYDEKATFTESDMHIYPYCFNGFSTVKEDVLQAMDMPLTAGRMPKEKNEAVITTYVCETFMIGGFAQETQSGNTEYVKISSPKDMIGKVLPLAGTDYTVVGVVEAGFDLERYRPLTEKKQDPSTADLLVDYALLNELQGIRDYSLAQVLFVSDETLDTMVEQQAPFRPAADGYFGVEWMGENKDDWFGIWSDYYATLEDAKDYPILWLDGEKNALADNEIILSAACVAEQLEIEYSDELSELFGAAPDYSRLTETQQQAFLDAVRRLPELTLISHSYRDYQNTAKNLTDGKVVGILFPDPEGKLADPGTVILASDGMLENVIRQNDGIYQYAVGKMPEDAQALRTLVEFCYDESGEVAYPMQNAVCFELDGIHELLVVLSKVFLYIGIGFAVFASLMLSNFIATSIIYKKQEIGILRAIGARGSDVYRIFFAESFVIAMINFVLSAAGTGLAVMLINYFIRKETGILVTLLAFSVRQVLLLFAVSLLVAALASFFPVKKIASKKPIDAIRGR